MNINTLTLQQAEEEMNLWIERNFVIEDIDDEYKEVRNNLINLYALATTDLKESKRQKYLIDIRFGTLLYNYLNSLNEFNLRVASNDGFWRYLSLCVIPDIVGKRWGNENRDHYYKKSIRTWLRSLWWYVHLSWQGNPNDTNTVLESENLNTDIILQLQERPGRNGAFLDLYRSIMKEYSILSPKEIEKAESVTNPIKNRTLFRTIMIMNTAHIMVMDPGLFLGGIKEYTRMLFREAGVDNAT